MLRAERYLKLDAGDGAARVVVSLTLGPAESQRVLAAADADGDGRVTSAEADAYMAQWGDGLRDELPVWLDGQRVHLEWGEAYLDPIGPVEPRPGTVEMVARLAVGGGRHTLTVRDRMPRPEAYDRTDVAFHARDGAALVSSGVGESPPGRVPTLAYGPDAGRPDTFTAIVDFPGTPESPSSARWWISGGAVAVALVLWVAVTRGRRPGRRR